MKDKIVFDIETKNTFADVGGNAYTEKLDASFIGAYSYNENRYLSFHENDFEAFAPYLKNASMLITFAGKRFDIPVIQKYFNFNVSAIPHIDLLEEIELAHGRRIGLDVIAQATMGVGKSGKGLDAIKYYNEGNLKALEEYCLQDVKVTKELYDYIKKNHHIKIPDKFTQVITTVPITINELEQPLSLF